MFERLGTITFVNRGWFVDTYSECHIYIDGSRILLKYDDYAETYISSQDDVHLNYTFIGHLKNVIKQLREDEETYISLKQMISYHSNQKCEHTKSLHTFIIGMLPGTQTVYSYSNDPSFMYKNVNTYVISHDDYVEYFLNEYLN